MRPDLPVPFVPVPDLPQCLCSHLLTLHQPKADGLRGKCSSSACGCRTFRSAPEVADRG